MLELELIVRKLLFILLPYIVWLIFPLAVVVAIWVVRCELNPENSEDGKLADKLS